MNEEELTPFQRKLAALKAQRGIESKPDKMPEFDYQEFVPDVDFTTSGDEKALDDAIKKLDIVEAYTRWCGKSKPTRVGNRKEGIKVSCPNPAHPDKDPSAWLNREKNVWYCSGCSEGGDVWDIAAWHFGYSVPGYKRNKDDFRSLRKAIGEELGFQVVVGVTGTFYVQSSDPASEAEVEPDPEPSNVRVLPAAVEEQQQTEESAAREEERNQAVIDWQTIIPESTFLREYMKATTVDDCPEEFHFWMGLMAIGFAVGRNRTLIDFKPVVPNLFVCLVGPSGARKSQSMHYLSTMIDKVMPYEYGNPLSTGVKDVNSPGSAEYIVKTFSEPIPDPADPKKIIGYGSVRARVHFDELATLLSVGSRMGSTMKPQLLEIYDSAQTIGSGSLTHGSRIAKLPFGQVTASTQNESISGLLKKGDDASGFMNRWVFASGKLKRQRSLGGVTVVLDTPVEYLKQIRTWAGTTRQMSLSEEAFTKWDDFFHKTIVPLKAKNEQNGSAMLTRIDLLMKKLMVLFACNMRDDEITVRAVDQVIALFPYLLSTYGVVKKEISRTDDTDLTDKITDAIKKFLASNGRGPSGSDLYRVLKRHGTLQQINMQLLNLSKLGIIIEAAKSAPTGKAGRPPGTRWLLNDAV